MDAELKRLNKLKDFRKLFADTAITTTHLLKKCIRVKRVELSSDAAVNRGGLTEEEHAREILR